MAQPRGPAPVRRTLRLPVRVLITSQAALGHFHPLAAIGAGLTELGHQVLVSSAPDFCPSIRAAGFDAAPSGMNWSSSDLRDTWPEFRSVPLELRNAWINEELWGYRLPAAMLPDLLRIAEEWRPDVILSGRAEIAGATAGELLDIPYASASAGRVIALSDFVAQTRRGREKLRAECGLPPDPGGEALYRYLYLNFIPPAFLPRDPRPWPTRCYLQPMTFDGGGEALPEWLLRLPPESAIYVSFGANQGAMLGDAFASAIAAVADLGLHVIVTVGAGGDPACVDPGLPNVKVEHYLPQRFVLERARLAICHGGINTILGALSHGVPLIVLPTEQSDQSWNAGRCEALGVGVAFAVGEVSVAAVRSAADAVLGDPRYRSAVRRFHRDMAGLEPLDRGLELLLRVARDRTPQPGAC